MDGLLMFALVVLTGVLYAGISMVRSIREHRAWKEAARRLNMSFETRGILGLTPSVAGGYRGREVEGRGGTEYTFDTIFKKGPDPHRTRVTAELEERLWMGLSLERRFHGEEAAVRNFGRDRVLACAEYDSYFVVDGPLKEREGEILNADRVVEVLFEVVEARPGLEIREGFVDWEQTEQLTDPDRVCERFDGVVEAADRLDEVVQPGGDEG